MKNKIKFGTDGWRARIADDFTVENLIAVCSAFSMFLNGPANKKEVIIGYDNRFQSEYFAKICAAVCANFGIKPYFCAHSLPSPVLSFGAKKLNTFGIMITASHNPCQWNGFKIKEPYGGSAKIETTSAVEKELESLSEKTMDIKKIKSLMNKYEVIDLKKEYFEHISKLVDIGAVSDFLKKTKIFVDPMHGSGIGYIKDYLNKFGIEATELHALRDPLFSGLHPEPLPIYLEEICRVTKESIQSPKEYAIGIALDGDADRIAAIGANGQYLSSHNVFSLLLYHFINNKKLTGEIVKTFNITKLIDKQCKEYGLTLHEVPIGFKHIVEMMQKHNVLLGGEESGGIGTSMHLPERDGSFNGLLLLELIGKTQKNLNVILEEIMQKHGHYYYDRLDLTMPRDQILRTVSSLRETQGKALTDKPCKMETLDGTKFTFDDESWILFRASGTEPLLRIYAEAHSFKEVQALLEKGRKIAII